MIEPYQTADRDALVALWITSWQEALPSIDFAQRRDWFATHLANWLKVGNRCDVIRSAGALAGFVMLAPASGHIDQICVSSVTKGTGVAGALMAHAKALCPSGLHLDVNADNHRAIGFYVREGFVQTGVGVNPLSGLQTVAMAWSAPLIV
jgi:putative acetyltransferase